MSTEGSSSAASSSLASMRDEEDPNDQFLEEFADKLVDFEDLEDDPCSIKESALSEAEQLAQLGIVDLDAAKEFSRTVLVEACALGLTRAISAIIRRLKQVHQTTYNSHVYEYLSAGKNLDSLELEDFIPTQTLPPGYNIKKRMVWGPLTALQFCLASGFFPGLRILVEEAMTHLTRTFDLTFCDMSAVIDDNGRVAKPGLEERTTSYLPKGWWSPLVFAISANKTKCALYALQRGAVPYWSTPATKEFSMDFMCTALYAIIAYNNEILFNQVMGRKYPTSPFPLHPIVMSPVIPRDGEDMRLILATLHISGNFYSSRVQRAEIAHLSDRNEELEIEIARAREFQLEEDPIYEELPRLRDVHLSEMGERLKQLETTKSGIERELEILERAHEEKKTTHKITYESMALAMVRRSGPWGRWLETAEDGRVIGRTGKLYDVVKDAKDLKRDLRFTFFKKGLPVDYSDPYEIAVSAASAKADSVFEYIVNNGLPLFKSPRMEEKGKIYPLWKRQQKRRVYTPWGRLKLLTVVSRMGTARMAEILIVENGMNPFSSNFGERPYKDVFGDVLSKRAEDEDPDYHQLKSPEYVAPYVRFLLSEAMKDERCFYRMNFAEFPAVREFDETFDEETTLLDMAVMADDRDLIAAAAALGGDPTDSLFTAVILDYPEAFYTLLGLGATSRDSKELRDILSMAREQPRIGEALKRKGIIRIPNLQSIALRALFEQTPEEREGAFHAILERSRQDLENKYEKEDSEALQFILRSRLDTLKMVLENGPYGSAKIPAPFLKPPLSPNKLMPIFVPRAPVVVEPEIPSPEKKQQTPVGEIRSPPFSPVSLESLSDESSFSSSSSSPSYYSLSPSSSTPQRKEKQRGLVRSLENDQRKRRKQMAQDEPEARRPLFFGGTPDSSPQEERGKKRQLSPLSEPSSSVGSQGETRDQKKQKEQIRAVFTACKKQDQKSVSAMLEQYPHLIKACLADGTTLSAYASKRGIQINQ